MKEVLRPAAERSRQIIATGTLSALALVGISSCSSDTETVSWKLHAACPDDKAPEITSAREWAGDVTLQVACADEAPSSVEIVSGPTETDSAESAETVHNIEVQVNDAAGGFMGPQTANIDNINIDDEKGVAFVTIEHADNLVQAVIVDQE